MIDFIPISEAKKKHWYIFVKNRESGPYRFVELLLMLHNKDIEAHDEITFRGLGGWKQAQDFENFKGSKIQEGLQELDVDPDDLSDIHFRKSIRIPTNTEVIAVMGNQSVKCVCLDLSTGGCLLKVARGKIKLDRDLKIHFYSNPQRNITSMNFRGEAVRVVSAEKLKEGSHFFDLIGVKFEELKKSQKDKVKHMIKNVVFNTESEDDIQKIIKRDTALSA